jgi:hypothetical protein
MSFDLEVTFAGLCAFVPAPNNRRVTVLLPDARRDKGQPLHSDGTEGVPHVGYIRFDLSNLVDDIPTDGHNGPTYEVVHRLDREDIDFNLPPAGAVRVALQLPKTEEFAPNLEVRPELMKGSDNRLLARIILRGGKLTASAGITEFVFPLQFAPDRPNHRGRFAGFATWKRALDADDLTINIGAHAPIQLKPRNGKIVVKIANLCSINPLEWDDLETRSGESVDRDVDFKWLYSLLQPKNRVQFSDLLHGISLPVPEAVPGPRGSSGCMGVETGPPPTPPPGDEDD